MDFWTENMCSGENDFPHVIVDLGYVRHPAARDRCDRIMAMGVGKRNAQIVASGRLVIRIPPAKLNKVLKAYPGIKEKTTYSWTTHSWVPKGANDLAYCWC